MRNKVCIRSTGLTAKKIEKFFSYVTNPYCCLRWLPNFRTRI